MPSTLSAHNLAKAYAGRPVVKDVSLSVSAGEIVGLLGPNGAGKTTCFYMIVGLVDADAGDIRLDEQSLMTLPMHRRARAGIGYLPQEASVFRQLSIRDNLLAILETRSELSRAERHDTAEALLEEFNVGHLAESLGQALSGGERRRVEIARALATEPTVILLDEPFAGVDAATERAIISVLQGLRAEGRTVVSVHHDLSTVREYFDNVLMLNVRKVAEGSVEEAFTTEALEAAYGGRLATAQIDRLAEVG